MSSLCILFCSSCASNKGAELPLIYKEALYRNERGMQLSAEGDNIGAAQEFNRSLKINRSVDNMKGIAINLLNLGRVYLDEQLLDEARMALGEATAISESLDDRRLISESYASTAEYLFAAGEYQKSRVILVKAIEIDQKDGSKGIGGRLNLAGLIYIREGELARAESSFKNALSKNMGAEDVVEIATSYRGLAELLEKKGMLKEAKEYLEKALDNDKKSGVSHRIALDLNRLGELTLEMNDLNTALGYYLRSYDVNLNSGDKASAAVDLEIIAGIYKKIGDNEKWSFYENERAKLLK